MDIFYSFAAVIIGGALYNILEVLWRGYTHPSMTLVGGICFLFILITEKRPDLSLFSKAALSAVFITSAEFVSGVILNIFLKLNVWDYSDKPFNILGQVCPTYFILWFVLSLIIFAVFKSFKLLFPGL